MTDSPLSAPTSPRRGWQYPALAALLGLGWVFAHPLLWRADDRTPALYADFALSSLGLALVLRRRIARARGWRLWALGAVVPVAGSVAVTIGLSLSMWLGGEGLGNASDSLPEALAKAFLMLPALGLVFNAMLFPLLWPLGTLWVVVLRRLA